MRMVFVAAIVLLPTLAFAQQPADPDFMQKALDAIATQRNNALNLEASCEANAAKGASQLQQANARIKELEAQVNKPVEQQK
jgi:phage regulator Rha-like protein